MSTLIAQCVARGIAFNQSLLCTSTQVICRPDKTVSYRLTLRMLGRSGAVIRASGYQSNETGFETCIIVFGHGQVRSLYVAQLYD